MNQKLKFCKEQLVLRTFKRTYFDCVSQEKNQTISTHLSVFPRFVQRLSWLVEHELEKKNIIWHRLSFHGVFGKALLNFHRYVNNSHTKSVLALKVFPYKFIRDTR